MADVDEFLASVLRLSRQPTPLHDGDAAPRIALWSTTSP